MDSESVQTFNFVIITGAVLLQTILLIGIAVSVARMRRSVEQLSCDVHRFLETASRSIEILNVNVTQVSAKVQGGLDEAEHITGEALARSRAHVLALDGLIGDFLRTAEYANREIAQITRGSFREARALNAGLRAGLGRLFRRRTSRERAAQ